MSAARKKTRRKAPEALYLDAWLLLSISALAVFGLIMVTSASMAIAENSGHSPFYFTLKQAIGMLLGVALALLALRLPLQNLERASPLFYFLCVLALLLVFLPGLGVTVNGARRWVNLGLLRLQMVEVVKPLFLVFLAGYLVRNQETLRQGFKGLVVPLGFAAALSAILLMQPDFGGALLLMAVTLAMVFMAGARIRDLAATVLLVAPVALWLAFSESYRVRRLKSFLDPFADPYDGGFQLVQALIAVGRGEWFGVGLGGSVQKLFYLPEAQTDFIFAVVAEELGLVGIVFVIGLFCVLVGRGLNLAWRAMESGYGFAGLLAFGISVLLGLQAAVSMGVNFGVLPTKGLTLPLVSYGGSSVMMTGLLLGLLLRVAHELGPRELATGGARA